MPAYFEAGKGSLQRPEDHKKFSDNWDLIFGKKKNVVGDQLVEDPSVQISTAPTSTTIINAPDESETIGTNTSTQSLDKPRLAGWWKTKPLPVEPKSSGSCPDCQGWGCWTCCTSEQEIRSRQGTFG